MVAARVLTRTVSPMCLPSARIVLDPSATSRSGRRSPARDDRGFDCVAVQLRERDRGRGSPVDLDVLRAHFGERGDPGVLRQPVVGGPARVVQRRVDDLEVPGRSVEARCRPELAEARREHQHRGHPEDAADRAQERRSAPGTAVLPVPGSTAMRTPLVSVGANPAAVTRSTTLCLRDPRVDRLGRGRLGRSLGSRRPTAIADTITTMPSAPSANTVQSACRPTLGFARRATPNGYNGDTASAPATESERAAGRDDDPRRHQHRDALRAGASEISQHALIDARGRDLAAQHDDDRDDAGERGHRGRDPRRDRDHVDRVPCALALDRQTLRVEE